MSTGAWDGPKMRETCPYCQCPDCEADWCDVGVGMVQAGPFHCHLCGASQIGPYDENTLDPDEKRTGWFKGRTTGTSVNTLRGELVPDHKVAEILYPEPVSWTRNKKPAIF